MAVCLEIFPDKWNEIIRRDFEAGGAYIISVTVTNLWGNFLTRKRFEDTQVFCKVSTVIPIIRLIYNNILYASSPGKNSIESDIRKKKKKRLNTGSDYRFVIIIKGNERRSRCDQRDFFPSCFKKYSLPIPSSLIFAPLHSKFRHTSKFFPPFSLLFLTE